MQKKPKSFPFIVLIHHPEVVHTSHIEGMADDSICNLPCHKIGFTTGKLEILAYYIPACIVL